MKRRLFVASSLAAGLAGCSSWKETLTDRATGVLGVAQTWDLDVIGTHGRAREYPESAISRTFPIDSLDTPSDGTYRHWVATGYAAYRLEVAGLVAAPQRFSLPELRAIGETTQITRHDCVEGWSAIGKWTGVRLAAVLALARPAQHARYVVFRCLDRDDQGVPFYESLSLPQAVQPQTLLALDLDGKPLAPDHGAPVRLRVPLQLGYKSAKWVARIELADRLPGKGGYWEDQGYAWYAGI